MFGKTAGLVALGLGAYAYYKYAQMSEEEKEKLVHDLTAKGQKLYDDYMPEEIKSMFSRAQGQTAGESAAPEKDLAI